MFLRVDTLCFLQLAYPPSPAFTSATSVAIKWSGAARTDSINPPRPGSTPLAAIMGFIGMPKFA